MWIRRHDESMDLGVASDSVPAKFDGISELPNKSVVSSPTRFLRGRPVIIDCDAHPLRRIVVHTPSSAPNNSNLSD